MNNSIKLMSEEEPERVLKGYNAILSGASEFDVNRAILAIKKLNNFE